MDSIIRVPSWCSAIDAGSRLRARQRRWAGGPRCAAVAAGERALPVKCSWSFIGQTLERSLFANIGGFLIRRWYGNCHAPTR
jgi:hypothetical protein